MLAHTRVNGDACRAAAADPALLATDLADYLVRKKVPFRQAHHAVGALVALAEKAGKRLDKLTLAEMKSADPHFAADALRIFDLQRAMTARNIIGAPGHREVRKQLARWKRALR
jgi:argininosuccinate lyase